MVADDIQSLQRQFTDKFVLVDASRPELARFRDVVGRVKTVNMNGQVLVEFDDYHLNTGWYDIAPEYLKVVDQPPPKPEAKAPAAKPAKAATSKPAAKAAPAAAPKAGKSSVADILAAARAGKAGGATAPAKKPAEEAPAPTAEAAPAKPEKVDRSKMSVADMLAAARAGGAAGIVPAKAKAEAAPAIAEPAVTEEAGEEESAPAAAAESSPAEPTSSSGKVQRVDKSSMTIDEMIAYCREHDAS